MKIVDRYLCARFAISLVGVLFIVILVVLIAEVRDIYGDILQKEPDIKWVFVYLGLLMPGRVVEALPLSVAVAALWTFGRLARQNELLGFLCGGISPARVSAPIVGMSLLLSLAMFAAGEHLLLKTESASRFVFNVYVRNQGKMSVSRGNRIYQKGAGRRFYSMDQFLAATQEMIRPTVVVLDENKSRPRMRVEAYRAAPLADGSKGLWRFYNAYVWKFDADGRPESMSRHTQYDMPLEDELSTFLAQPRKPNEMGLVDLYGYAKAKGGLGQKVPDLWTDFHLKMAFPLAPLVVTLLVCSYALQPRAGRMFVQFGTGFVLVVVYYAATVALQKLGHRSVVPPFFAAWLPNFVFLALGGQWFVRHARLRG